MTEAGFPSLPSELVLQIAIDADDSSLLSLLLCNTALCTLLAPVLHTRALASRGPQSAIQWAATRGHVSLVKFLLARGIHPDAGATNDEPPALQAAVARGRADIVELLASHGADLDRQNYNGNLRFQSVIHIAAVKGDAGMIKLLADHGADVGSQNAMGMYVGTPLHLAVLRLHIRAVQTLLALQVPVDDQDSSFSTPLDVAEMVAIEDADTQEEWDRMVEIGKMLVNAGAPVPYTEEGVRALGDGRYEEKTVRFQRIMIAARKQYTLRE